MVFRAPPSPALRIDWHTHALVHGRRRLGLLRRAEAQVREDPLDGYLVVEVGHDLELPPALIGMGEHRTYQRLSDIAPATIRHDEDVHEVREHGMIGDDASKGYLSVALVGAEAQECAIDRSTTSRDRPFAQYDEVRKSCIIGMSSRLGSVEISYMGGTLLW